MTRYATIRIKPDTAERVSKGVGLLQSKRGKRVTADDFINAACQAIEEKWASKE